jgi:mannose/fructose/N-acetylgalactosamine-specific phosphotransferase system component IIB
MPIILARIDERLIHGQIMSSSALARLRVNQIIIVDGVLKDNSVMQCIYNSSAQSGDCPIEGVTYLGAAELNDFLQLNDSAAKRFLAIFRDLATALEAARDGTPIPALNLGNYTSKDPLKKSLTDAFSVGPTESLALNELHALIGRLYFNGLNSRSRPYCPAKHSWDTKR